jgi:hypothetical protein
VDFILFLLKLMGFDTGMDCGVIQGTGTGG